MSAAPGGARRIPVKSLKKLTRPMHLPTSDDRKRHVYIIARLLDKGATRVPPAIVAKKLLRLATKMEQQLFEATQGRPLGEDSIRHYLVTLAHAACKRTAAKSRVEILPV